MPVMDCKVINDDCLRALAQGTVGERAHLTFLDPPFNQNKDYAACDDNMDDESYWSMMTEVCRRIFAITCDGGALYFMQREKNAEFVLRALRDTGWTLQNLIIWKKKTSAVPVAGKYGKHYQIIAYATRGKRARAFHRLRIDPALPASYKQKRDNGVFVTDVWDDIRELTSGYFAGKEAIRDSDGGRFHKQQSPVALLLRIILSSSQVGDCVFDPYAGTGTTLAVARQLGRRAIGVEIDAANCACIERRLAEARDSDSVAPYYSYYAFTDNIEAIWGAPPSAIADDADAARRLFG